ncbi:STAS/SEC14 domain-containing protein [Rhodovulum marinum]|uniref:SpoIIAA-like protein n=1 Tax=Rhodovulum marinum TaxID=320662 RepID=A0A4R2PXU0_9RHOB|nr:STAS/SEC14 domain-containing protein [Rhodovulum marinum]TCP39978.1 SpoIIAA-like protein [Rhodovulum marinum]
MIEMMDRSEGNRVAIHVTGRLHQADYDALLPKLEELFRRHGKLRVLFYADAGFEGWDLQAAWADASLGFGHMADFDRLALVGAPDWVVWCVRLSAFLFKGEVRIFTGAELETAWDWLCA